jgi:hypothetical protein
MNQLMLRRFVTVGALAAILFLAASGSAQARGFSSAGAWGWLQEVWSQGVAGLWNGAGTPAPARNARDVGGVLKGGLGVDPNGSPGPNSLAPSCATCTDSGPGLDPSGRS